MNARELLENLRRELSPVEQAIRAHRYLAAPPAEESLRVFAGEQYTINGSRAELALAFLANLAAWGENCRRLAGLLRDRYDTSFFDFFAEAAAGFEERALAVADQGLAARDSPTRARRAARLLQAYELLFWDTLADAL
jgi:hypothetical protein